MDLTNCPECGELAEVEWRAAMESTDGPIEHAKIRCVQKHWFLLPVASLERSRQPVTQRSDEAPVAVRVAATRSQ
jgi:hypothetical protein